MRMADKLQGEVTKDIVQPLMMRSLYSIGEEICFSDPAKRMIAYESKTITKLKSRRCYSAKS
jgi:hypothetical protein